MLQEELQNLLIKYAYHETTEQERVKVEHLLFVEEREDLREFFFDIIDLKGELDDAAAASTLAPDDAVVGNIMARVRSLSRIEENEMTSAI